jgi:hypothetical protein
MPSGLENGGGAVERVALGVAAEVELHGRLRLLTRLPSSLRSAMRGLLRNQRRDGVGPSGRRG